VKRHAARLTDAVARAIEDATNEKHCDALQTTVAEFVTNAMDFVSKLLPEAPDGSLVNWDDLLFSKFLMVWIKHDLEVASVLEGLQQVVEFDDAAYRKYDKNAEATSALIPEALRRARTDLFLMSMVAWMHAMLRTPRETPLIGANVRAFLMRTLAQGEPVTATWLAVLLVKDAAAIKDKHDRADAVEQLAVAALQRDPDHQFLVVNLGRSKDLLAATFDPDYRESRRPREEPSSAPADFLLSNVSATISLLRVELLATALALAPAKEKLRAEISCTSTLLLICATDLRLRSMPIDPYGPRLQLASVIEDSVLKLPDSLLLSLGSDKRPTLAISDVDISVLLWIKQFWWSIGQGPLPSNSSQLLFDTKYFGSRRVYDELTKLLFKSKEAPLSEQSMRDFKPFNILGTFEGQNTLADLKSSFVVLAKTYPLVASVQTESQQVLYDWRAEVLNKAAELDEMVSSDFAGVAMRREISPLDGVLYLIDFIGRINQRAFPAIDGEPSA
jgi:hypothetical protein